MASDAIARGGVYSAGRWRGVAALAAMLVLVLALGAGPASAGIICQDGTASGSDSTACGAGADASGDYASAYGFDSKASGQQASAYGAGSTASGDDSSAFDGAATGLESAAFGGNADAQNATALGVLSTAGGVNTTAVGNGSLAGSAFYSDNFGDTAVGAQSQAGYLGDGQDQATAIGYGSKANALQATTVGANSQATASNSVALGFGSVANVVDTVSVGSATNQRKIVNVADGVIALGSTDATTGGELYTANQNLAAALGTTLDANGQIVAPSYTIQGADYTDVGSAFGAVDTALTAESDSITSLQNALSSGSIGLVQQDSTTGAISVGASTGGTSIDLTGTAGSRVVTGVAAGTVDAGSTDAVNGSQLYATNQQVATNTSAISALSGNTSANMDAVASALGGGASVGPDGLLTAPGYDVQGQSFDNVGGALGALDTQVTANTNDLASLSSTVAGLATGNSTYVKVNSTGTGSTASGTDAIAIGEGAQATKTSAIALGVGAAATGANAIAIGTGAVATGSVAIGNGASAGNGGAAYGDGAQANVVGSTALGPGAAATAEDSVAIGSNSVADEADTVSVGSSGNQRRITNVAAGVNATDAVNVGQLQSMASGLQSQVDSNLRESRAGTALALAASSLQYDMRPGKASMSAAVGNFKGETGLALGVGFAATDRWRFNASLEATPDINEFGVAAGASFTLN